MSSVNASFSSGLSRTTVQQSSQSVLSSIQRTQSELIKLQEAIATGKLVRRPSDAPATAAAISELERQLETRTQQERNLDHAQTVLDATDFALSDATETLRESVSIALSQIGVTSDPEIRENQALVIDGHVRGMLEIFNRQIAGVGLFTGNSLGGENNRAFGDILGGIHYQGSTGNYFGESGTVTPIGFNSNGLEAIGAVSARVHSAVDLQPTTTEDTFISELRGGLFEGVRLGAVSVTVDGEKVTADLNGADTMGDVVTRINHAIAQVDPAAGSIAINDDGFTLTAAGSITIADIGAGKTAGDLGIRVTASGSDTAGASVGPRITEGTALDSLGAAIDFAGGLTITNGETTKTVDFAGARTVQDLMNRVESTNLGVKLEINSDGQSFNMVSYVSGVSMTVREANGTTAADLGLDTFGQNTALASFNDGRGIKTVQGSDDFEVSLHDGRTFGVNLDGAQTVSDVLATIRQAATDAGVAAGDIGSGAEFSVGLSPTTGGFTFEDNTAGGESFSIVDVELSQAAENLGINRNVGQAGAITGDDFSAVRVDSLFTHLIDLRNALSNDDERGIEIATSQLESDLDQLITTRADISVRAQRVSQQKERSEELGLAEEVLLGGLQDADLTEVITRFQQLQLQLQASFQTSSQSLQLSLLDFLR